jgi:AsmA protein
MRRALRIIGIALAVLVLALFSLPFLISANQFKPALESKLSAALGRQVTIGNLGLSILSGGVTADGIAIADDPAFGNSPFLQAKSLKIGVDLWPLLASRKLKVRALTIDQPQVALLQSPSGRWNYSSLGGTSQQASPAAQTARTSQQASPAAQTAAETSGNASGSLDLSARLVRISSGRFSIGKTGGRQQPLTLENVNLEVRDFSPSAAFPFSFQAKVLGGGDIKLAGTAGAIDANDVEMTPVSFTLNIAALNLASAFAGAVPDIGGVASFEASGASAGGLVTVKGKLTAEGLKLARNGTPARLPVEFDFAARHDLRKHAGSLDRGDIHVGAAVASLTGTYMQSGDSTVLATKFTGTKMPVPELAALLPPLGIALPNGSRLEGGTATAAFTVNGPSDRLLTDGSVSVDNTRLANFDLGSKMSLIESLAGIRSGPNTDIQTLSAKLRNTPAGTAVEDLNFVAQGVGELNGSGTVSPANALDFKMSATVQTTRSAALSRTAVPFFIQGTAMDPVFKPDVRGFAKSEAQSILQSEAQKALKGKTGQAAQGLMDSLFGNKKK